MSAMIGPPPGAYLGPYPTEQECIAFINLMGQPQTQADLDNQIVRIGATTMRVQVDDLLYYVRPKSADPSLWQAAIYQGQCAIVKVPRDASVTEYFLFDLKTAGGFAVYFDYHDQPTTKPQ